MAYLHAEHTYKKKKFLFDSSQWHKIHAKDIGIQPNCNDCGVFLCHYARMVCEGEPITSCIDWLTGMRRHMSKEIFKCTLENLKPQVSLNMLF